MSFADHLIAAEMDKRWRNGGSGASSRSDVSV